MKSTKALLFVFSMIVAIDPTGAYASEQKKRSAIIICEDPQNQNEVVRLEKSTKGASSLRLMEELSYGGHKITFSSAENSQDVRFSVNGPLNGAQTANPTGILQPGTEKKVFLDRTSWLKCKIGGDRVFSELFEVPIGKASALNYQKKTDRITLDRFQGERHSNTMFDPYQHSAPLRLEGKGSGR